MRQAPHSCGEGRESVGDVGSQHLAMNGIGQKDRKTLPPVSSRLWEAETSFRYLGRAQCGLRHA